jgi:HEAT repeat protein
MGSLEVRLEDILTRARQGERVVKDEVAFAVSLLENSDPRFRASACEIMLRVAVGGDPIEKALECLTELCSHSTFKGYFAALLICLSFVPREILLPCNELRDFAIRCSSGPMWQLRANAVSPLGVFARSGDTEAKVLLWKALDDENEYVRNNAAIELG